MKNLIYHIETGTKYLLIALLAVTLFNKAYAQQDEDPLKLLKDEFKSFNYGEVINTANKLLEESSLYTGVQLIEIYRMKGIAHFSLSEDFEAEQSFRKILEIDRTFELNTATTSPKIVSFFSDVKNDYLTNINDPPVKRIIDTVFVERPVPDFTSARLFQQTVTKSMLFPGLGHFDIGENTKGWFFSSLSVISLSSMIYFIIDTDKKEDIYLAEKERALIQTKYNDYNFSYKMRNISIIALAAVWLYTQIDLMFFSEDEFYKNDVQSLQLNYNNGIGLQLSYRFSF